MDTRVAAEGAVRESTKEKMGIRLSRRMERMGVVVLLFALCAGMSWYSGIFRSEFGRYQDEGMHYVIGLCIQDYLTSGNWTHPLQFAQQYYLHFPKIAFGQWPPGFSLMQVVWGLVFGVSRISMLWGMVVLTVWLAYVTYRATERYFGTVYGLLAAIFLMAAPLTQAHTAMVMAEIPLAAASFLAMEAFVRLLNSRFSENEERGPALWFAFWTFAAIMIKGNGWVIVLAVPLIIVVTGRWMLLLNKWFWIAAVSIGILCVPYTLATMRITSQGWDTNTFPGWDYMRRSLGIHIGFVGHILGWPLTAIAVFGAAYRIFRGKDTFWKAMSVYGVLIIVFHTAIPTSIEQRKIYQIVPVMCVLLAAGLDAIAELTANFLPRKVAQYGLAAAAVAIFVFGTFSWLPEFNPGFAPVVKELVERQDTRNAAVLLASNPFTEDAEAAIIAEWASRERKQGTYLIRATKLLSHQGSSNGSIDYIPNYSTEADLRRALDAIPVSYVIIHTATTRRSYLHHELLRAALRNDPGEWEKIDDRKRDLPGLGTDWGPNHEIEIYRCRRSLAGVPVHYSVDLSHKIGSQLSTQ